MFQYSKAPEWVPAGHKKDWVSHARLNGSTAADSLIRDRLDRIAKSLRETVPSGEDCLIRDR